VALGLDGASPYYHQSGAMSLNGFLHNMSILSFSRPAYHEAVERMKTKPPSIDDQWQLAMGHLVDGEMAAGTALLHGLINADPTNHAGRCDDALIILGQIECAVRGRQQPDAGVGRWLTAMRDYPTADRAADAAWYVAKGLRAAKQDDLFKRL